MNSTNGFENELADLKERLEAATEAERTTAAMLRQRRAAFNEAERRLAFTTALPRRLKQAVRTTGSYILGRRNRKWLYSSAYRKKDAHNRLKPYTRHLYELGFTEQALRDLKALHRTTRDKNLKQAAAWELALWHANAYTPADARQVFHYAPDAVRGLHDRDGLRRAAIITAESAALLGFTQSAEAILSTVMHQHHADLYLAMANLEENLARRAAWINKATALYDLAPIMFTGNTYEDLSVAHKLKEVRGPKVTVIMPAYNSEAGIRTGITSILNQTWQNIELIIVDDCSTDDTLSVARDFQAMDDRVKILSTPVNSGPYVARNLALKEATGLLVTVNDADDWSHPEKIAIQAQHLLCNDGLIANTSAHSRLTETLKLHRRGTPGRYIFPNMSSLMFRRKEVLEQAGYWDEVRFAADSEFKRRLVALFGAQALVDLDSGPLSFPRQASGSLTGSAAFGYKGFLMGVRKEYAEVHRRHHQNAASGALKYLPGQTARPYPVPEPMWISREEKPEGHRTFDVVMIGDFRLPAARHQSTIREIEANRQRGLRTGLIQMNHYDATLPIKVDESIRRIIDGDSVQMLVYGESIHAEVLLIRHPEVFMVHQHHVPSVKARIARGITDGTGQDLRKCARNAAEYVGKAIIWHPVDSAARQRINRSGIRLSAEDWTDYAAKLKDWLI